MASVIKLRKGLNINLTGQPQLKVVSVKEDEHYVLVPDDFTGVTPKVMVKAGDAVQAGTPLMTDKFHPEIKFVSPVGGTVEAVNRGERRKVLSIVVKKEAAEQRVVELPHVAAGAPAEEVKAAWLNAGVWPFIKQRPYNVVANPDVTPRDIFVTAFDSAPLAPDFQFVVKGEEEALQAAISGLAKLTKGKVYVGAKAGANLALKDCVVTEFDGPHPAGNVGVQINHVKPINKGEIVWTVSAFDLLIMGRVLQGKLDFTRTITIAGSEIVAPAYARVIAGTSLDAIVAGKVKGADYSRRFISGNVLTGQNVGREGTLGFYDNTVTVIPDGAETAELFGWATPGAARYSTSFSCLSALVNLFGHKEWTLDARLKGGRRALIVSGEWEKVFPMDIYPEQLYKAVLAFDIDKMEALGIYEVAPEDFALCEFVDASKTEIQQTIADGLARLKKEME